MKYRAALALLTLLFFMWGFITVLNDILIPHLKGVFQLSTTQAMLVQFAFFGAYFACSLPAGRLVGRLGYQWGIVVGLAVTGVGALLFYPASVLLAYPLFLGALFVLATGITILQVAANPYVTVLGPPETAASRLNLTQGLNSLGTTIGPVVGTLLILEDTSATPIEQAQAVQGPYVGIAVTLAVLALLFAWVRLPVIQDKGQHTTTGPLLGHRTLRLGVGAIFLYVGAEVSLGSIIVEFLGLPHVVGLPPSKAGFYVSLYWGAAMVGRFIGAAVQQVVAPHRVLAFNGLFAVVLLIATMALGGSLAMWTLLLVGLANSIMFPTIFSLSIAGLGDQTSRGAGYLVMAIVGGALIPVAFGALADLSGLSIAIGSTALCYAYIVYFAWAAGKQPTAAVPSRVVAH